MCVDEFLNFTSLNKSMLLFVVHDKDQFDNITNLNKLICLGGYNKLKCDDRNFTK